MPNTKVPNKIKIIGDQAKLPEYLPLESAVKNYAKNSLYYLFRSGRLLHIIS
jgi:hypothetical protein